jgi:hypothetical protein
MPAFSSASREIASYNSRTMLEKCIRTRSLRRKLRKV